MNILVFSWRDPKHPLAGGAEQVMHEHAKGWVKSGHIVTHFSSHFSGALREETLDGIKIIRRGAQLFLGVQIRAFFWYLFSKHPKYDLVIDQFHGMPFFTPLYVKQKKLAVIQEVAKEVWFLNELPKPVNLIIGVIGYLSEPWIFKLFYTKIPFLTGSKSTRKDLIKLSIPAKNITIIPHGVMIDRPKIIPQKGKKNTIIFLGALAKDKGIEDAIKTFALLSKDQNYQFWVVGMAAPWYLIYLKNLSEKLGLKNKVTFWGRVDNKLKFRLLAKAHILINPSVREGWGLVNIEANAMRTPVVAYNSPGLIDSVKDNFSGLICQHNAPENLAQNVLELTQDKNRYQQLKKNALLWSKRFSWKSSRKKSLELIKKVLNES